MGKLVILKLGEGSLEQGFTVTLQIGEEGDRPSVEVVGKLPPAPELAQDYSHWQSSYRRLGLQSRLEAPTAQVTNVAFTDDCQDAAQILRDRFTTWLQAESFRTIREKWLEQLSPIDEVRVILQGADPRLQRLPWHLWDLIERYAKAEIALSAPIYERLTRPSSPRGRVKILAILGNSAGIDVKADRAMLERLPNAEVQFLVEPQRQDLNDQLWEQRWDVLFFAGHSISQNDGETGQIRINPTDSLTMGQLRYALKKAMERGLKLAIFNSCDGLGLARDLADLQIPQIIVMREPVPDRVAQVFLKYFLAAFSRHKPLYLAVREARERLQGMEDQFPCAAWLPVICQNPAEIPPTWASLTGRQRIDTNFDTSIRTALTYLPKLPHKRLRRILLICLVVTAALSGIRYLGLLQPLELDAFDTMIQLRPDEGVDPRLLLITISDEDLQRQPMGGGSLSDDDLNQLLKKLEPYRPRVIGLDIYRNYRVHSATPELAERLQETDSLIAVCKGSDPDTNGAGIAPPPEVKREQVGFSDFVEDSDGILRRQLLFMTPDPASLCTTSYAFSTQLALHYLAGQGIVPGFTNNDDLRLGTTVFKSLFPHSGGYQGIDARGSQILLNYRSTPRVAAQVSLTQVLNGQSNLDTARDKIVLVGVTAQSAGDYWATPYGAGPTKKISGVQVQAHMVSQILSAVLDQRPQLWVWNPWVELIWLTLWSTVGGLMAWRIRPFPHLAIATAAAVIILYAICFVAFLRGGWLPLVPAALTLVSAAALSQTQSRKAGASIRSRL